MSIKQTKYSKVAGGVSILFSKERLNKHAREYLSCVAKNCDFGGMFMPAKKIYSRGSVLTLLFDRDRGRTKKAVVQARAIVRRTRRFGFARGMELEFVEFSGLGKLNYVEWLDSILEKNDYRSILPVSPVEPSMAIS